MAVHALAEVYQRIRRAGTTLVFVNTRAQAEIAFQALWHLNDDALPIALHHGSLAVGQRRKVEAAMAAGRLRAVVATSSLDLGIDWAARSEEHTSELQSLMRISYAVFCLKKKTKQQTTHNCKVSTSKQ